MDQDTTGCVSGRISSRRCPFCGHHEVGFVMNDGSFYPLKPGMTVYVPTGSGVSPSLDEREAQLFSGEDEEAGNKLWVPEPLRGDRKLRKKYGVLVGERAFTGEMSGGLYDAAYLGKLESLIERERDVPLAVILDRFFTAPHLGSGNPLQIAEAMWRELDEIRHPAQMIRKWLEKRDEESLAEMIYPKTKESVGREPEDDKTIVKELNELSLEEFLEMLA